MIKIYHFPYQISKILQLQLPMFPSSDHPQLLLISSFFQISFSSIILL